MRLERVFASAFLRRVERLYSILAVRSRSSTPESDLTAVARIRNAALLRFARDGFGVGLRTIAADAGVTAGLIAHHFGSKDGLRRACDAEVLRLTEEVKRSSTYFGGPTDLMTQMSQVEEYIPATAYAMRSLMEGGELATTLMDLFVGDTVSYMSDAVKAGTVTPSHNEEARARYLLYAGFGALLLFLRYEASEPGDIEAAVREFIDRYGPVTAELYSPAPVHRSRALRRLRPGHIGGSRRCFRRRRRLCRSCRLRRRCRARSPHLTPPPTAPPATHLTARPVTPTPPHPTRLRRTHETRRHIDRCPPTRRGSSQQLRARRRHRGPDQELRPGPQRHPRPGRPGSERRPR